MRTFTDWILKQFDRETLADIAKFGCQCGFSGITMYRETIALYRRYKDDIWNMLYQDAESFGYSIPELIATFGGAKNITNSDSFENLLVWYAAEKIAYQAIEEDAG